MSKYTEVMDKVRVDDSMRERILLNIEKEASKENGSKDVTGAAVRPFDKNRKLYKDIMRYAGIAAAALILFASASAVLKYAGGSHMDSATVSQDASPAMEAEAPAEAEMAAEPVEEAVATEDAEMTAEPVEEAEATEDAQMTAEPVEKTESAAQTESDKAQEPQTSQSYNSADSVETTPVEATKPPASPVKTAVRVIAVIMLAAVIVFDIILLIRRIRRRKDDNK